MVNLAWKQISTAPSTIQGNEIATHCAKIALQLSPIQNIPIPLSDLILYVKSNSVLSFQNYWNLIPTTNKLRSFKVNVVTRNSSNDISRQSDVIFTRLRTGHTRLTHLRNLQLSNLSASHNFPWS